MDRRVVADPYLPPRHFHPATAHNDVTFTGVAPLTAHYLVHAVYVVEAEGPYGYVRACEEVALEVE